MKIEDGQISASQLLFSIACYIQSSTLLTSFFTSISQQDTWIVVLAGLLVSLPFLWIYITIIQDFPKMDLIQINDLVFGPWLGKFVSILYLWYFLDLASLNLRDVGDFVGVSIMPETPMVAILIPFILVCAWAVHSGIEVVVRYGAAFVAIALIILALTFLLTLSRMKISNFLPMLTLPALEYFHSTNIIATIPFGESVVFLMIASRVRDQAKIKKSFLLGFIIGGITMLLVVIRDTAVLGNMEQIFSLPSYETMRLAGFSETFTRMDILYAIVLLILLFFKISLLYYIIVMGVSEILSLESYQPLVLTAGALIVSYAFILYHSSIEHVASGQEIVPILWLLFELILPFLTLFCSKIRKSKKSEAPL